MVSQSVVSPPLSEKLARSATKLDLNDLLQGEAPVQPPPSRRGTTKQKPSKRAAMPLRDHLIELRRRLILSVLGIIVAAVVGWMLSDEIFAMLQSPFLAASSQHGGLMTITFNGIASAFNTRLGIAVFIGLLGSSPWWAYQLWAFITPALTRKELWSCVAFIAFAVPLFIAGAAIAWCFLPQAIVLLTGFAPANTATLLSADVYFTFVLRMTVAFGLSFELPVVMVALTIFGLVSWQTWLQQWRIAFVIAFVFAAIATPTGDIGTLCAFGLPICMLYMLAVAACWLYAMMQMLKIRIAMEDTSGFLGGIVRLNLWWGTHRLSCRRGAHPQNRG